MLQNGKKSEIMLVYMDCPDCGSRKEWADRQYAIADKNNFHIRKVSFVMKEARGLMLSAKNKFGINSMPFFTDGKKFSKTLEDFVEKSKAAKKSHKKKSKSQVRFEKALKEDIQPETSAEDVVDKVPEVEADGISAEA